MASSGHHFNGCVVALALLLWIRRCIRHETLSNDQGIVSYILSAIAVVYCVLLGFIVINVQDSYKDVKTSNMREADVSYHLSKIKS